MQLVLDQGLIVHLIQAPTFIDEDPEAQRS